MSSTGFVNQAFRNMVNWKWYHDYPVNILFHHLLHIANVDDIVINGLCVKAGSILTTIPCLSFATGLTEKQIRTACEKLISSNDISINSFHKKGSIITIVEWDKYVLDNSDNSKLNKSINFDEGRKTADKGQIQSVDDNHVTTPAETKTADKGQINDENDANGGKRADKMADKLESQHVELQNNANETICDGADKRADIGQKGQQPKEPENKESSPTPLKENKEEENSNSKEKNINININKKENFSENEGEKTDEIENQPTDKKQTQKRKPVYTIIFNFEKSVFEGITEQDMALWRQAYPAIDVGNEILKAACWLSANPKNAKSNYKSFLNKWFTKAQDHSRPVQQMLQFPSQMSYADRKRQQSGPDATQVQGFMGKQFDFDKDAKDNPF